MVGSGLRDWLTRYAGPVGGWILRCKGLRNSVLKGRVKEVRCLKFPNVWYVRTELGKEVVAKIRGGGLGDEFEQDYCLLAEVLRGAGFEVPRLMFSDGLWLGFEFVPSMLSPWDFLSRGDLDVRGVEGLGITLGGGLRRVHRACTGAWSRFAEAYEGCLKGYPLERLGEEDRNLVWRVWEWLAGDWNGELAVGLGNRDFQLRNLGIRGEGKWVVFDILPERNRVLVKDALELAFSVYELGKRLVKTRWELWLALRSGFLKGYDPDQRIPGVLWSIVGLLYALRRERECKWKGYGELSSLFLKELRKASCGLGI